MTNLLKFQKGNAKLDKTIYTFSLPAGHSCPFANDCLSKANRETGKITDGKELQFRCFAASSEAIFTNVRLARWHNFDLLRKSKDKVNLILSSLPKKAKFVRIHVSGDFFNQDYFNAWLKVAELTPNVIFYAYTKSLDYWVDRLGEIPTNLRLTASYGGRHDHLITQHSLKYAKVVFSLEQAKLLYLEIDHDDSHAITSDKPFALLIHGTQPKGSESGQAMKELTKQGVKFSYSK